MTSECKAQKRAEELAEAKATSTREEFGHALFTVEDASSAFKEGYMAAWRDLKHLVALGTEHSKVFDDQQKVIEKLVEALWTDEEIQKIGQEACRNSCAVGQVMGFVEKRIKERL